jgi:colanic acid/amylovoran biosynthesis protein
VSSARLQTRVSLFGASLDTGNLGVSALGLSALSEIAMRRADVEVTMFDHRRGLRPLDVSVAGRTVSGERRGAWISRRLYRGESLWTMLAASRLAPWANANVRSIDASSAVLDASGGDSFADIYGQKQLDLVMIPKQIALNRRRPLILLPQTYGPFSSPRSLELAVKILVSVDRAWARDPSSYARLQDILGDAFDATKHREGVDVAFALPATDPGNRLGDLAAWLEHEGPTVGVNVSGLLANTGQDARDRFGLSTNYLAAMQGVVRTLLRREDVRVLLVPHVRGPGGESDDAACKELASRVGSADRVAVLPDGLRADEVKHVVGRLAWLIGARMHATIAALSSGVPAAAVAYSDKFQGVFDRCGVGHRVLDARRLGTADLVDAADAAFEAREADRLTLARHLPAITDALREQFDELASRLTAQDDTSLRTR